MKLIKTLAICLCAIFSINAQEIKVLDQETKIPVAGVTIYNSNKDKSVITKSKGALSNFALFIFRFASSQYNDL